ncbi:MAG: transcriptional regulator [Gammaproteobacteria bacterium]|nr:transcriptional regulator [Gammaproteobacteria bacterium]
MDENKKHRWPKSLAELYDMMLADLQRARTGNEEHIAELAITSLSNTLGGRITYIPKGKTLKIALRNAKIYNEHGGKPGNIARLSKQYDLSMQQIYAILRSQHELRKNNNTKVL